MSIQKFFKEALQWKLAGGAQSAGVATYATDTSGNVTGLVGPSGVVIPSPPGGTNGAVIVGDSRVQNTINDSLVASKQAILLSRGWWPWLQALSGGYFTLLNAAGVAGDTIANVNSRWSSTNYGSFFNGGSPIITTGSVVGVSFVSPKWIFCEIGINNIAAGQSLASMSADAEILIANAKASGAYLVWITEGAVGSAAPGYNTAYLNRLVRWNQWLKQRSKNDPFIFAPDTFPVTVTPSDAAGNAASTLFIDGGIHPNNMGAYYRAVAIWNAIKSVIKPITKLPQSTAQVYNSSTAADIANRQIDPLLFGTSTAVTGTGNAGFVPLNYVTAACTNCTVVWSIISDPDGFGNAVQADVTWTGASGSTQLSFPRSESLFVGGETASMQLRLKVQGVGGVALTSTHNVSAIIPQFRVTDSTAGDNYRQTFGVSSGDVVWNTGSLDLTPETLSIAIVAGTPTRVQGSVYINGGAGTSSGCRVIISRPTILV